MESQTLSRRPLLVGHANVGENFQPADMDLIVHPNRNLAETCAAASSNPAELLAADPVEVEDTVPAVGPPNDRSFRLVLHGTENHYRPP